MINKTDIINQASSNDKFLILGYGLTGKAVAHFLEKKKLSYYVLDEKINVESNGFCIGSVTTEALQSILSQNKIKAVFPSPGVSLKHPAIALVCEKNIPMIGELELASLFLDGEFIAVTGTNGKSTTAMLIDALLKDAGIESRLSGNIGLPLIEAVDEPPVPYYVIEESSYQLELVGSLKHKIAVCLNVTEDHFDRYDSIEDYALAKKNIVKNSHETDWFVYNADNDFCQRMSMITKAQNVPFSLVNELTVGGFVRQDNMVIRLASKEFVFALKDCFLKGPHNWENMLAALLSVLLASNNKRSYESYKKTLKTFKGLSHRLEKVHSENGVDYYNDSKATNVGAVVMALAAFEKNIILIAGGQDKQCDYKPLRGIAKAKVKKLILIGEAKEKIYSVLEDVVDVEKKEDMNEAVLLAKQIAQSGDVVLLSPACASYDQYKNYEERGLDFVRKVKGL